MLKRRAAHAQRTTITANKPICTHLSNQILLSQFSFGKAEPGKTSRMVTKVSHNIPGQKEGVIFFNRKFSQ